MIEDETKSSEVFNSEGKTLMDVKKPAKTARKKPYVVTIVILIVLLLGVMGFGVYEVLMNLRLEDEIAEIRQENENLSVEMQGEQEKTETEDETEQVEEKTEATEEASEDYIYVGQWGIKIKVPEELKNISYNFTGSDVLYVSGVVCGNGRCQYVPQFLKNSAERGTGLGALSRVPKDQAYPETIKIGEYAKSNWLERGYGKVVYIEDDYFYAYEKANGLWGPESEWEWEKESTNLVEEMLKNNISEF